MKSVIIGKNQAGQRLDKFLHKYLPLAGDGFLHKMLRKKNITLNGKKAEGKEILALNDQVCIFFSEETFAKFTGMNAGSPGNLDSLESADSPERVHAQRSASEAPHPGAEDLPAKSRTDGRRLPAGARNAAVQKQYQEYTEAYERLDGITILYEDEDCLILNKPSGLLSQKAAPGDITLNEWLIGYLLSQNQVSAEELRFFRPSVCNRLDRNTTGIVLCGKSLAGLQYLSQCVRERSVRKFYRTICVGALREAATVHGYLVKEENGNRVTVFPEPTAGEFSGCPASASSESSARAIDSFSDFRARFLFFARNEFFIFYRVNFHLQIYPVEQRTGKFRSILRYLRGRASANFIGRAQVSAWARVHTAA